EAFDVADLQRVAALGGCVDQVVGVGHVECEWFFDEDVDAVLQQINRDAVVEVRRDGDDCGVDLAEEVAMVSMGGNVEFGGDCGAGGFGRIDNGDEVRVRGEEASVDSAEVADADDGESKRVV